MKYGISGKFKRQAKGYTERQGGISSQIYVSKILELHIYNRHILLQQLFAAPIIPVFFQIFYILSCSCHR